MVSVNDGIDGGRTVPESGRPSPDVLARLVQRAGAVAFACDPRSFRPTFVGSGAEDLLGYPIDRWLDDANFWIDHVHPADRDRVIRARRSVVDDGHEAHIEYRMTAKDERTVWVRDVLHVDRDVLGEPSSLQGLMVDVSERHDTTEALRDSEERFRQLSDTTPEGIVIHDDGVIVEVNHTYAAMFGYQPEELIGAHILDMVAAEDRETVQRMSEQGIETPYIAARIRKDGTRFVTESRGRSMPLMGRRVRVVTVRDMTGQRAAAAQLHEVESRFRTLVEQLPATVFITAAEEGSRVLYMSPYQEELTGYPAQRFIDDPYFWKETLHPDDRAWVVSEAVRTDENGEPFAGEYRIVTADGAVRWVQELTALITDDAGRPLCWQGVMLDVTARKEAEQERMEAEAKYRSLVEQLPAAVHTMPPHDGTKVLYMSPGSEALTGFTQVDFDRDPDLWEKQLHPDDRDRIVAEARRTDRTGERFRAEYRMIAKDGRIVWTREDSVLVRASDGTPLFWQGVSFDITELKHAEQELALALAREQEASQRLRVLDQLKTTFLEAVSHELRTPLTAIIGSALTIRDPGIEVTAADAADLLDRLIDNARKLDRLLSELLDLDRLGRGIIEPKRRPMDVSAAVRQTIAQASELIGERPVHVQDDGPVVGVFDAAKLERILENLLANAARHTPPGTPIWVRLERVPDGVVLTVDDAGSGVEASLRPVIFEPFRQGASPAAARGVGVGIGLSLVARFAELHGGRAWVEDREGGGASFRVFLRDA
jgi:PAS domain S-box-containing protein